MQIELDNIIISDSPVVTIPHSSDRIDVNFNTSVTISCIVNPDHQSVDIQWRKMADNSFTVIKAIEYKYDIDQKLMTLPNQWTQDGGIISSLTIHKIDHRDTGFISCYAGNRIGSDLKIIFLNVIGGKKN